jgi:hypothetical protein
MGRLKSSLNVGVIGVITCIISKSASPKVGLTAHDFYNMSPKNSFRGGSRGKGGKVKYPRR